MLAHQRRGLRRDREAEPRREARDAQHAQRILGERRRHVPQHAARAGRPAPPNGSISVPSSPRAIALIVRSRRARSSLERDVGRREELEAAIAAPVLALGARERVFLVRFRMQEHREVAADRADSPTRSSSPASRRRRPSRGRPRAGRAARRGPRRRRVDLAPALGQRDERIARLVGVRRARRRRLASAARAIARRSGLRAAGAEIGRARLPRALPASMPNIAGKRAAAHAVLRHRGQVVAAHQLARQHARARAACSRASVGPSATIGRALPVSLPT